MKKTLSVVLALILFISTVSFMPVSATHVQIEANQDLYALIYDGMANMQTNINVSSVNVSVDDGVFAETMDFLFNNSPELFYVNTTYSYNYTQSGAVKTLSAVVPSYLYTSEQITAYKAELEQMLDDIIADIPHIDEMSDFGKVVSVHDYLSCNYAYDYSLQIHDVYTFLKEGKGVCQAFTGAFTLLMRKLGIDVSYSRSGAMTHIWNLVNLGGKWYNLDATWDDYAMTEIDIVGLVRHDYLLKSDSAFITNPPISGTHYGDYDYYDCTDTAYDALSFDGSLGNIIFVNSTDYYYVKRIENANCLVKNSGGVENTVMSTDSKWFLFSDGVKQGSAYSGTFSGIDIFGNDIYMSSFDKIMKYNIVTEEISVFKQVLSPTAGIYGLTIKGNKLMYTVTQALNAANMANAYTETITLEDLCASGHSYGEWTAVESATAYAEGKEKHVCSNCGHSETRSIPMLTFEQLFAGTEIVFENINGINYVHGFDSDNNVSDYTPEGITILNADGTEASNDGKISTKMTMVLGNNREVATVILKGDVDGNGIINASDYILIRYALLEYSAIDDAASIAADLSGNGIVDASDYIFHKYSVLGSMTINQ